MLLNLNFLCNVTYKYRSLFVVLFFSVDYCIVCLSNLQLLNLQAFLGSTLKLLSCSITYFFLVCRSTTFDATILPSYHWGGDTFPKTIFIKIFTHTHAYVLYHSFTGGGNRSTRRKPPTCPSHLNTLSYKVESSTPYHERGSNSQFKRW
jgi:hypothetical protein